MMLSLFLLACSGGGTVPGEPGEPGAPEASVEKLPVLVYTQSVDGEIEPCG